MLKNWIIFGKKNICNIIDIISRVILEKKGYVREGITRLGKADLGWNLDSRSAKKVIEAVMPEKNKACITAFIEKVGSNLPVTKN